MKAFLLTLCMTALTMLAVWEAKAGNEEQNSLVTKLQQAYQGVSYFQADFKQQKSVKFLSKPITSTGQLVFSAELGLVWEVKSPVWVKTLINDDGVFKSNSRQTKQKVKDPQIKVVASILTELLSSQLDRVESQFHIRSVVEDSQSGKWSVTLEAKGMLIKKAISSITIQGLVLAQVTGQETGLGISITSSSIAEDETTVTQTGIESLLILDATGNETNIYLSQQIISQAELTQAQRHAFD